MDTNDDRSDSETEFNLAAVYIYFSVFYKNYFN